MKKIFFSIMVVLIFAAYSAAVTVNFSVTGWGAQQFPGNTPYYNTTTGQWTVPPDAYWGVDGYPGDTIELLSFTGTLDLVPGTYIKKINTLAWTVDYTYAGTNETASDDFDAGWNPTDWEELEHNITANRTMTIDTVSNPLNQAGLLENKWDADYLSFNSGTTTSFVVQGYLVEVTPLGMSRTKGWGTSYPAVQNPLDFDAEFVITEVPEPMTLSILGIGGLFLRKRK